MVWHVIYILSVTIFLYVKLSTKLVKTSSRVHTTQLKNEFV